MGTRSEPPHGPLIRVQSPRRARLASSCSLCLSSFPVPPSPPLPPQYPHVLFHPVHPCVRHTTCEKGGEKKSLVGAMMTDWRALSSPSHPKNLRPLGLQQVQALIRCLATRTRVDVHKGLRAGGTPPPLTARQLTIVTHQAGRTVSSPIPSFVTTGNALLFPRPFPQPQATNGVRHVAQRWRRRNPHGIVPGGDVASASWCQ